MGRKYKIHDQQQVYFVTFTVVGWIDLFIREEYKEIIVDSIKYCQQNKGLELYAWCIMTSHIHLIIGTSGEKKLEDIIRDIKRHTSTALRQAIENNPSESRKTWMLHFFESMGMHNSNNHDWQLWQQHNHPIELSTPAIAQQRLNYIHENPVEAGFVTEAAYWRWSSAYDYSGGTGMIDIIFID
jgi:putative transposase